MSDTPQPTPGRDTTVREHTLLDNWEPIFVNGNIPTEFRDWFRKQTEEAMVFAQTRLLERLSSKSESESIPTGGEFKISIIQTHWIDVEYESLQQLRAERSR